MDENKKALNDDELEQVAGGSSEGDYYHDLSNFDAWTVCNVVHYDNTACLTLRREPNGSIIQGVGWQNGDRILIHRSYTENGWRFAYDPRSGKYGFVNPRNVR